MEDRQIVELFWQRDEQALAETERAYGAFLRKIAGNVLGDGEDSRECVNDTLWKAWNAIPPQRPAHLGPYLGRIVRRTAIDRYRAGHREKRSGSVFAASLEELAEVAGGGGTEEAVEGRRLAETIESYLRALPARERRAFVARYFYADSIKEIARQEAMSLSAAKSLLYRTRQGLKRHLEKEGFTL